MARREGEEGGDGEEEEGFHRAGGGDEGGEITKGTGAIVASEVDVRKEES